MKLNSSEIYLIGDNQILELIWENQLKWGTSSDWGQSDIGIELELIWENQFKWSTLSDWGQSDIGINLGKSIQVAYFI